MIMSNMFGNFKNEISIATHFLKLSNDISKAYIPLVTISSIFQAIVPFVNIIMPKYIIDELLGLHRVNMFVLLVVLTVLLNALLNLINKYFDKKVKIANISMVDSFELHVGRHIMNMDFENIEDPKILDLKEKALFPIRTRNILQKMIVDIMTLTQVSISLIILLIMIITLSVWLIAILVALMIAFSFIINKSQKAEFKFNQEATPINRKFIYYFNISSDFSMAKDIRIYNIPPLILKKIEQFNSETYKAFSKFYKLQGRFDGISSIITNIQMIIIYAYMVYKVYISAISIGSFTMYVAAAISFAGNISKFLTILLEFRQSCKYLSLYMEFEKIPSKQRNGKRHITSHSNYTIEFKNVYFRYPRSENYVLEDISLTIHNGEKLSIVGQNGAGKTTFIKLLCRLYEPEKGVILLNGTDINEYDYNEYMNLLSVVFQDFKLFAFTIKQNIAFDKAEEAMDNELMEVLKKSGLSDVVKTLSDGINTSVYKIFNNNGIELSGGQSQKLAISRALYKNAPIIALDEPTAALDPYAEAEVFSRLNELVNHNTAVYISHRLSSCRFCDKIAVFDKGKIIEYGTHNELIENTSGKYHNLWKTQAQYYNL